MSERHSYPAGAPNWVDIGSPDPDASASFYSGVFGWEIDDPDPDPAAGGYRMARIRGRAVAGIGSAQNPDAPPWWTTYIAVDDADTAAKRAEEAGGTVLAPPFDVITYGRMAVVADPAGATFSVWQPKSHAGSELVNEHGSQTWNELHSHDVAATKDFYGKTLGWRFTDLDMGIGFIYTMAKLTDDDEQGVAGIMPVTNGTPDHWKIYFAVDDCDATAAKVTEFGGTVVVQPNDLPGVGRIAVCKGPHGEEFSIIKNAPQAQG